MLDYKPRPQDVGHLIEERTKLFDNATSILDKCSIENRAPTLAEERTIRKAEDTSPGSELSELTATINEFQSREKQMASLAPTMGMGNFGSEFHYNPNENKGHTVNVIPQKLNAFRGPEAEKNAAESGRWVRNFLAGNILAAQTEGTPSAGGYTVPVELARAIINVREQNGVSRKLAKVYEMGSDSLDVPRLLTGTTTTYPGEANAITPSDPTWGQISFTAKKRATLVKISNELLSDNIVMLGDFVAETIGKDQAATEDGEFILGDATGTYGGETGLLNAIGAAGIFTAATGTDTWAEIVMADFTSTMAKLPSKYGGQLSWLCSREFYYSVMLRLLAAAGGNNLVVLEGGAQQLTFLGFPVFLTSKMPTATAVSTVSALFGSFSEAVAIGSRQVVEVQSSRDKFFDEDCFALRGISRYDINAYDCGDGSTAGGITGLKTAAS